MRHDYMFPRTSREAFGDAAQPWQFDGPRKSDRSIALILALLALLAWVTIHG